MAKNLREELNSMREEIGLIHREYCTRDENKEYRKLLKQGGTLPAGVHQKWEDEYYRISKPDLNQNEIDEYLRYKEIALLKTIKNCAVFFTVLTVIGIIAAILGTIGNLR